MLRTLSLGVLLLACATAPVDGQDVDLERQFYELLDDQRYDLARKLAIMQFRPDLHCEVDLRSADTVILDVQERVAELESAAQATDAEVLERLSGLLDDARVLADQAQATAEDYVAAGLGVALAAKVRIRREHTLEPVPRLEQRLELLQRWAKSLSALFAQSDIDRDDITNLEPPEQFIIGLHLADRGEFERALDACFVPLQLSARGVLQEAARTAAFVLETWHEPAGDNRKWTNLVDAVLETGDALSTAFPDRPEMAGWMIALGAHLARDHYDVQARTIRDMLREVSAVALPSSEAPQAALLQAKLAHERFLLLRRHEQWDAELPPIRSYELFLQAHAPWYAVEMALMVAASEPDAETSASWAAKALDLIGEIESVNGPLAASLRRRHERYEAIRQPFVQWLEIAQRPDYRDRRGTVLPDVLVETRGELIARVRAGFEELIAAALANQDHDRAFQLVQQGKALTVGRTLTVAGQTEPGPIAEYDLIRAKFMSEGLDRTRSISERELFIEYFFGPSRAWAFYLFSPGDQFQDLAVVELDRPAFEQACRLAIEALQSGGRPEPAGSWLLSGRPDLALLWNELGPAKRRATSMPRLVVAPDGPLCFLPLDAAGLDVAASVAYLPTAAVLRNSKYLDARRDALLFWESQRGDLAAKAVKHDAVRGRHYLLLWPGVEIEIQLKDE